MSTPSRPWPVVLLSALGAWLAAIPFFAVAVLLMEPMLREQEGALLAGLLMLAGALALLRAPSRSLFVENLGVPTLLAGLTLLGWGLSAPLGWQPASATLGLIALGLGPAVPQTWVRNLLGALASPLMLVACTQEAWWRGDRGWWSPWLTSHLAVGAWLGSVGWLRHRASAPPAITEAVTDLGNGWIASALLALAWWSGSTFLLNESLKLDGAPASLSLQASWTWRGLDVGSVAAALAAMGWLASHRPAWRQAWCAGLAAVACGLAAFMPALGGVLLVAAACLTTRRPRMATWAAIVALWTLGAFYHQLAWPLATKALVLCGAGVLLGVIAAWGQRAAGSEATGERANTSAHSAPLASPLAAGGRRSAALALGSVAMLLVANIAIWQNEALIRDGRPVYVALAPVDPRSLMQGDYMALRFATDRVPVTASADHSPVYLVFRVDPRGIATAVRQHRGETLQPDELIMRMRRQRGNWLLVTDAFHFKEGEAQRWSGARFGEFRVEPNGRALLVGLRGPKLESL